jgi:hypothetical protein
MDNKTKKLYEQLGTYEKVAEKYHEVNNETISINTIKSWCKGLSEPSVYNKAKIDRLYDKIMEVSDE